MGGEGRGYFLLGTRFLWVFVFFFKMKKMATQQRDVLTDTIIHLKMVNFMYVSLRARLLQSCTTLRNPMDCSPPGSFLHGILQTGTLEWVATPFSRGSSRPRDRTHVSCGSCIAGRFFAAEPPGEPLYVRILYHN